MTSPLEARLRALSITTPPGLRSRVLTRAGQPLRVSAPLVRRRAAGPLAVVVALLLVVANVAALHYLPAYAAAVGGIPGLGPLAQETGIVPSEVRPLMETVTADGHTVRLVGVQTTPLETIAFVQIDNQPMDLAKGDPTALFPVQATLTDQLGKSYQLTSAGHATLFFEPISGAAATVGARLTLSITLLVQGFPQPVNGQLPGDHGPWTFTFDATITPFHALPAVAPLTGTGYTCSISHLQASGDYLSFSLRYIGPAVDAAAAQMVATKGAGGATSFVQPTVTDRTGSVVEPLATPLSNGWGLTASEPAVATASWAGVLPGPGTYTLSCSAPGSGAATVAIQVA